MEEVTKQEGDFSLKGKSTKPKQLNKEASAITKVSIKAPELETKEDITKVVIPNDTLKSEEDTVQKQETKEPVLQTEQPKVELQEVGQGDDKPTEDVVTEFSPLQEVTEEEVKQVTKEAQEAVRDEKVLGRKLPENVEKLVNFMEETGGTVEDYVRLNADYSNVDETQLLREYYRKTKPYLDNQDMDIILEDYEYDEDLDEDRDIRKKKIAFKEEVNKARGYHKALYAARNADTIAQHFYEQGKADSVKEVVAKSKNITTQPRKTSVGSEFVNGWKVKAVNSGSDTSRLIIKNKKFN